MEDTKKRKNSRIRQSLSVYLNLVLSYLISHFFFENEKLYFDPYVFEPYDELIQSNQPKKKQCIIVKETERDRVIVSY